MKKVLKWAGLGVIGLVVIIGAGLALAPILVNPNDYKSELSQAVEAATGRPLHVDGDITLSLFPAPRLRAAQIRYPNIDGGQAEAMLRIEAVEAELRWLPLLSGVVHLKEVRIVKPDLVLERSAGGDANWDIKPTGVGASGAAGPTGLVVILDQLTLEGGQVRYIDAKAGVDETISGLQATLRAQDLLAGPYQLIAKASLRGRSLELSAKTGAIGPGRPLPIEVKISMPGVEVAAKEPDAPSGSLRFGQGPAPAARTPAASSESGYSIRSCRRASSARSSYPISWFARKIPQSARGAKSVSG